MADSGEATPTATTTTARLSLIQPCSVSLRVQMALYIGAGALFVISFIIQLICTIKDALPTAMIVGFACMSIDCLCLLLAFAWLIQLSKSDDNPPSAETDIDSPGSESDPSNDNEENVNELGDVHEDVPPQGAVGGASVEVHASQQVEKQSKVWKGQGETQVADRPKSDEQDSETKSEPKSENKPDMSEGKSVLEIMKSLEEKMQTSKIPIIKFTSFDSDEPLQNGIGGENGILVTSDA